jgi:hypothetical protein
MDEVDFNQNMINSHLYHLGVYNEITTKLHNLMETDRQDDRDYQQLYSDLLELIKIVEIEENLLHRAIDKLSF